MRELCNKSLSYSTVPSINTDLTHYHKADPVRQAIADSWPKHLDDSCANQEWGWQAKYTLSDMVEDMLEKLSIKLLAQ